MNFLHTPWKFCEPPATQVARVEKPYSKPFLFLFQVMKDWSDLEDKYQEMREKDSNGAEEFKKKMTERFQRTVQALEEESQAEKRQLQAMHQQRVISRINQV